jgi:hypothetical protein
MMLTSEASAKEQTDMWHVAHKRRHFAKESTGHRGTIPDFCVRICGVVPDKFCYRTICHDNTLS